MTNTHIAFAIPHNIRAKDILRLLSKKYTLSTVHRIALQRQYLDSFDWRMHQKSYICGMEINDVEKSFFLKEIKTDRYLYTLSMNETPKFPRDIPHTKCSRRLAGILDVRALMTIATVNIQQRQLNILDDEQKTLVRLHVESYSTSDQTSSAVIPGRLIIFPVRGYVKIFQSVVQYISEQLNLSPLSTNLLDEILAIMEKVPDTALTRITKALDHSLNAWEATRILLNDLLNVLLINEQGIRDAIDTEFLHDYRVAVRRTRSVLTQIKHIFSNKELEYFKQEFYWLGVITSPTRDLDVYLLEFDNYTQALFPKLRDDLIPFQYFLRHHWKLEHTRLCEALNSERYQKLIRDWKKVLKRKSVQSSQAFNASKPARQVVNHRILGLYKKVLKEGDAIKAESPDEDLHELRKTCKKIRYLMEFFQNYYPPNQIKRMIKKLKLLQDNLGKFQDLCVQIQQISEFAQQMQDEGLADTKTIMAMGVLVQNLVAQKKTTRSYFSEQFKKFASPEIQMDFKTLFNPENRLEGVFV
ncbi:MAG: CHAD domain-containing protein [Nitrosomonas sp.]|nr:CHAD domain-containing protein [Nitrosomonas sp.]